MSVYGKQRNSSSNLKAFSWTKNNVLREFLQGQNVFVNLPTGFPAFSVQSLQMHCAYSAKCNLDDSSSVKTNRELNCMIFTDIRKLQTLHVYLRPGISEETKETNKPHGLKATIIRFARSKFRIFNAS